ncbi:MAG: NHLP leader peptide family RiPP precursor [Microbacterium sp.]
MTIDEVKLKATTDAEYRDAFIADPRAVLAAEGIHVPEGVAIRVLESTEDEVVLAVPPYLGDQLDEEQLDAVTGGVSSMRPALEGAYLRYLGFLADIVH